MNRLIQMNKQQRAGLVIMVVALIAAVYSYWPHMAPLPPLEGTYLTQNENEISWLSIETKGNGAIACVWNKILVADRGEIKENRLAMDGDVDGKNIRLSALLPGPAHTEVTARGLREKDSLRLSLAVQDKVFYTGLYDPSDRLSVATAASVIRKHGAEISEQWQHKMQLRDSGGADESEQMQEQRKLINKGNEYIKKMSDFAKSRAAVETLYKNNTAQVRNNLENARRIPGAGNKAMRGQLIVMMRSAIESTQNMQLKQNMLMEEYSKYIIPFFDGLSQLQERCADAKKRGVKSPEESMCVVAGSIQQGIILNSQQLQPTANEIIATYKTEYAEQMKLVAQAEAIQ